MKKSLFAILPFLGACAGQPPTNIGIQNGQLTACPDSPNCGSAPLEASREQVQRALLELDEANIVDEQENYLYAEFTSSLMGYVDDVEFMSDAASGMTHVRSASRLGYSDLGANRKRIEAIRAAIK